MATVSGFGFSGTDHPNTIFENMVGRYFGKKRSEDTAALNYAYAQRYAENGPTWSVTGLRKAGLNPILATGGGFSPSMGSAVQVTDNVQSNGGSAGGESPFSITRSNRQVALLEKQTESNIENLESQTALNSAQAAATTMKAQAEVAESNARIAKIQLEMQGGGFKHPLGDVAARVGHMSREIYDDITKDSSKVGYLNNGPSHEEISLMDGTGNGKVYVDSDEVKKYGTKEAAVREFFRRVGESKKRYDDRKKEKRDMQEKKMV